MITLRLLPCLVTSGLTFFSLSAFAFYSTIDTGEIIEPGKYRILGEAQGITDNNSGLNVNGRVDWGLNEESSIRGLVGVGTTDFHLGGFFKWVPIPDYSKQPAIGVLAGLVYAHHQSANELSLRVHPMVSKGFDVDFGKITPYGALPFGLRSFQSRTDIPLQLAGGTELIFQEIRPWRFFAEVGFDLNKAFSYFSLAASYDFDAPEATW